MNLWLINHYANPPGEPGDARHWSHARELIARGHQATIICSSFHHLKHAQMESKKRGKIIHETIGGVPFVFLPSIAYQTDSIRRVAGFFEFGYRVWRGDWARGMQPPDLILGSSPHPFAALGAQRLAVRYRAPFLLELRDAWPYVLTEVGGYSKRHPFVMLVDWTARYLYRKAARIIYFSRDSVQSLVSLGADEKKIVWVPHGVDLKMAPKPLPPPDDGVFTVMYIGAHNQWNSLDTILDAARHLQQKRVRGVQFRFVGDGVQKPLLQARAEAEHLENVHFDDPVPKNRIGEYLHRADAFILNNRVDGVSRGWMSFNKIYEYLAAQRPVIFGSCTTVNPIQESGAGIVVEAGNAVQIADAVENMSRESSDRLEQYGRLGRKHIEDFYSIESIVKRFEKAALEVLSSHASHTSTGAQVSARAEA